MYEVEGSLTHQTVWVAFAGSQHLLRAALLLLLGGRALSSRWAAVDRARSISRNGRVTVCTASWTFHSLVRV